jgi:hypothetical protein
VLSGRVNIGMPAACIPGCGDRPSFRGRAWKPTAPAVKISRAL